MYYKSNSIVSHRNAFFSTQPSLLVEVTALDFVLFGDVFHPAPAVELVGAGRLRKNSFHPTDDAVLHDPVQTRLDRWTRDG